MPSTAIKTTDLLLRPEFAPKVLRGDKTMTRRIVKMPSRPDGWHWWPEHAWVDHGFPTDDRGEVLPIERWTNGRDPAPLECYRNWYLHVPNAHPEDYARHGDKGEIVDRVYPQWSAGDRLRFLTTWAVDHKWDRHKPLDLPRHVKVWTAFDNGSKPRGGLGKLRPGRFMPLWMRKRLPVFELTEVLVERINEITSADIVAEGFPFSSDLDAFKTLWAKLNGAESWKRGDWCWVLSFQRVDPLSQEAS